MTLARSTDLNSSLAPPGTMETALARVCLSREPDAATEPTDIPITACCSCGKIPARNVPGNEVAPLTLASTCRCCCCGRRLLLVEFGVVSGSNATEIAVVRSFLVGNCLLRSPEDPRFTAEVPGGEWGWTESGPSRGAGGGIKAVRVIDRTGGSGGGDGIGRGRPGRATSELLLTALVTGLRGLPVPFPVIETSDEPVVEDGPWKRDIASDDEFTELHNTLRGLLSPRLGSSDNNCLAALAGSASGVEVEEIDADASVKSCEGSAIYRG